MNLLAKINPKVISIITPVYNTDRNVLIEMIESVRNQTYYNWELCICDDCSTSLETIETLELYKGIDSRIKIVRSPRNLHISLASNYAAELATGEFLAFVDHDDTLAPTAIEEIVLAAQKYDDIDLLYTDEDKIDEDGNYCDAYFKPDWSPQHLLSVMYVLHILTVRKSLFFKLGGFRDEYSGSQDYDLALRVSRVARRVHHIPKILYHWRKVKGSASAEIDAKPYALLAAKKAIANHLEELGNEATVEDGLLPGTYRVRYKIPDNTEVTLVILTHDISREIDGVEINLVRQTVKSIIEKSTYKNYKILVVDDHNSSEETKSCFKELGVELKSFTIEGRFNYSSKVNYCLELIKTNNFIILNDDLKVISPDWIESLLELSIQPEIGGVGAKLLYLDNTIQHCGVAVGEPHGAMHTFHKLDLEQIGYYGQTHLIKNYSAVTGAVFASRLDVVRKIGYYNTTLATDYNDVDYCLRIIEAGFQIVLTPYALLYHLESSSIVRNSRNEKETEYFYKKWSKYFSYDRFMNYQSISVHYPGYI